LESYYINLYFPTCKEEIMASKKNTHHNQGWDFKGWSYKHFGYFLIPKGDKKLIQVDYYGNLYYNGIINTLNKTHVIEGTKGL
jgi:hypothetical protein